MNFRRSMNAGLVVAALFLPVAAFGADGVKLPAFQGATFANGTEVALIEKRDTPLISLVAVVRGGALGDAEGKAGTASLLADLMQKGAGPRDATQFAEAIENVGGALQAGADAEDFSVGAGFMARDADLMLELVADTLQRPRLESAQFEKVRTLAIQGIAAAKDSDPRMLVGAYGDAWLFAGHPYGRPVGGSEASLARIEIDDLKRYYADHLGGDRLIVAVVGDFDAKSMRVKLERAFGQWRKAGAALPAAATPARLDASRVLLVDKPGTTQTYFWLGNTGASRTDPDRTAQNVVNTVFGGRFTSMLSTELRIKGGLTYSASSGFDRYLEPGSFSIRSSTPTATTVQAVDLALATLARLRKDGLAHETLASAQQYMLGQFPPSLETNGQLAGRLADLMFYRLGREDVDQYADRIRAVDAAAVTAAIEKAFPRPEALAIVVIGDAASIRSQVARYGPVTEMKITDPEFAPARSVQWR